MEDNQRRKENGDPINSEGFSVWVDGSYEQSGRGGVAYMVIREGQLITYEVKGFEGVSPFHMEVMALLMVVKEAIRRQIQQ